MVVFPDKLFSDMSVSVCEEVPVLAFKKDLISQDERTDEVSELSLPMCNLRILHGNSDMGLSHGDTKWFCLLSSADWSCTLFDLCAGPMYLAVINIIYM